MIEGIIFDIDGVLFDSFESNFEFFQKLMQGAGYPVPSREAYRPLFPRTMREVIVALTQADEKEVDRIWEMGKRPEIRSGMKAMLPDASVETVKRLSEKHVLGIVTGRTQIGIDEYFEASGLRDFFTACVTYEDTVQHKPDPEPLHLVLKRLGVLPEEAVYIGDALVDVQAAHAAGMKIMLYGPNALDGADFHASHFEQIPEIIESFS